MGYTKVGPSPIVNFTSEYVKPLVALKTYIKAQGGGGTPQSAIPITGFSEVNLYRRGGNLWNETWERGTYSTSDGRPATSENAIRSKTKINIKPNVNFAFYNSTANAQIRLYYYDRTETFLSYTAINANNSVALFTTPANAYYMNFAVGNSVTPVTTNNNNLSVNYPNTDTQYHAYNPQSDTFTLSLGQTVYGGYVDWENDKLVVTHAIVDMGSLTWSTGTAGSIPVYVVYNFTDAKAPSSNNDNPKLLSDIYTSVSRTNLTSASEEITLSTISALMVATAETYANATAFKNAMVGHKLVYELATPIEISLPTTMPSTIEGVQNWFADSGDIELCYTSFLEYHKVASVFVTQNSNVQVQTALGSLVNFTTSLVLPLVALKTYIKAQGGGGTPSAPVAITGFSEVNLTRAGKNLVLGVIEGGSIGSNGTIAGGSTQYDMVYAPIKAGVTYNISTNETTNQFVGGYFTSLPSVGSTSYDGQRIVQYFKNFKTFTAPITGYVVFRQMSGYEYAQLEVGSMATAYEEYNADTFTLSLGQTVYGGYVDWGAGELVITHKIVDMGDLSWSYASSSFKALIADGKMTTNVAGQRTSLCEIYNLASAGGTMQNLDYIVGSTYWSTSCMVVVKDSDYSDATIFKNAVTGHNLVYELATPIELSLPTTMPSTIEGVQNWFADSGDIELEYKKIM